MVDGAAGLHLHQLERKRAWQQEEEEEEEEEEIRKVTIVCVCRPWVGDRLQRRGARALFVDLERTARTVQCGENRRDLGHSSLSVERTADSLLLCVHPENQDLGHSLVPFGLFLRQTLFLFKRLRSEIHLRRLV